MGTQIEFLLNTHFGVMNMGSVDGFLYRKLVLFAASLWASVSTLFPNLFSFFNYRTVFRAEGHENPQTNSWDCLELHNSVEQEAEANEPEGNVAEFKKIKEDDDSEETESPKFFFKFQYQTNRENYDPTGVGSVPFTSTNKYEFLSGKDFSCHLKEPEVFNLTVKELYANSNDDSVGNEEIVDSGFLSHDNLIEQEAEESIHEDAQENSMESAPEVEVKEKLEAETVIKESGSLKGKAVDSVENVFCDPQVSRDSLQFLSDKSLMASESDTDSITSSREFMSRFIASTSDGFLSDRDFEDEFELDILRYIDREKAGLPEEGLEFEDISLQNLSSGYEADDFDEEDSDIMEELENLEESNIQNSCNVERSSEKDSQGNNYSKQAEVSCDHNEPKDGLENSEKVSSQNSSAWDSEDSNELETLWEHQDLIEQLKMELKKVRATGLPTIFEEDESPKIMEDLKPWKIDEKFQREDRMSELHKFYRSYRERMRKFDILNYQKMYAMGFLQSKDPLQSLSSHKASASVLTSLLSQTFLLRKRKKSGSDPTMNFIRELHSDLEMVYVGQMCLSWEILHWQYEKAIELWESDLYGMHRYNEVAGEFQQFQVLLQRFIENEPFEGPRVQNYVKNRCLLRNLLQVPVIREDGVKDKKARRKEKEDDAITSDKLVEIMEETIRIFWQFVRADKDAHTMIQKGRKGTQIEPQDPTELELLTEVQTSLQKKEKRLKEILRCGSCILRKFQKHQEDRSDQVLYFFSQVDMKLVSRVLNMSKITTDQLLWCRNKLGKIAFIGRKIHVEPSFLLFPY